MSIASLVFSLSPLIQTETIPFEYEAALSASSRLAEPPCGVPCVFIEEISLHFVFFNHEAWNLENGAPIEQQLFETSPNQEKTRQGSFEMPKMTSNTMRPCSAYDRSELYRNPEENKDIELPSLFRNDTYTLPLEGKNHVDGIPRYSIGGWQRKGSEAGSTSLDSSSWDIDSKHLLRLADAGMQSIFCKGKRERATGVRLSNEITGLKLYDISPALFSTGYIQVGFYDFELWRRDLEQEYGVTNIRSFHTIIIFLVTSLIFP